MLNKRFYIYYILNLKSRKIAPILFLICSIMMFFLLQPLRYLYAQESTFTGSLQLSTETPGPETLIEGTVIDQDLNTDSKTIQTHIGIVTLTSDRLHEIADATIIETGVNTGVFTFELQLYALNNNASGSEILTEVGHKTRLGVLPGDIISIRYSDDADADGQSVAIARTFSVNSWDGIISTDKLVVTTNEQLQITVIDADANVNPNGDDLLNVRIYSDTDPVGINLPLEETGDNTGVFQEHLITTTGPSKGNDVAVSNGDTITVTYSDRHPADYSERIEEGLSTEQESSIQIHVGQLGRDDTLPPSITEVEGVPYPIRLDYVSGNTPSITEVNEVVSFDFGSDRFEIVGVDIGSFKTTTILDDSTVLFSADSIAKGESRTGLIIVLFNDGDGAEKHRELTADIQVQANGKINSIRVGPESATFFTIVTQVVDLVDSGFKLASEIYDKVVPCLNVKPAYRDNELNNEAVFLVNIENCSAHPEIVRFSIVDIPQDVIPIFSIEESDIPAGGEKTSELTLFVPSNVADDPYAFKVKGEVIFRFFDRDLIVSSSTNGGLLKVNQPYATPEFPAFMIPLLFVLVVGGIAASRLFSRK